MAEDTAGGPVAGVRLEFLMAGSPKRESATSGGDGKYSIVLPAGLYQIILNFPDPALPPHSGRAWLAERDQITLNVRVPKQKFEGSLEYDFLGEWRVTDEQGRAFGQARAMLEALEHNGRRSRFPVYVPSADDEKESEGAVETAPDGRFVFRIREAHIVPDKTVALVATADAPGFLPHAVRVYPDLQFSETGHLFAVFPDELQIRLKRRP